MKSGSQEPGRIIVGSITMKQAEKIAQEKMKDLNAFNVSATFCSNPEKVWIMYQFFIFKY